jgi:hypothetical protein
LEKTPEVENKYKEVSLEDKKAEIEKIKSSMSEDEIKDTFTIKTEKKDVSVVKADTTPVEDPKPEVKSNPSTELNPQIEKVAQTLMSQGIERVHQLYKDFDVSGIVKDSSIDTLTKVTLLSTVAEPNAIKMTNIEKNLKNEDNTEGTKTETKSAKFSAPDKSGKVDKEAGQKLYTQMCEQLGLEDETKKEKSE